MEVTLTAISFESKRGQVWKHVVSSISSTHKVNLFSILKFEISEQGLVSECVKKVDMFCKEKYIDFFMCFLKT